MKLARNGCGLVGRVNELLLAVRCARAWTLFDTKQQAC